MAVQPITARPKNQFAAHTPCPCGSGQTYVECCGLWHAGLNEGRHAPTPEALMRSRYSAYVLGCTDYLRASLKFFPKKGEFSL